MATQQNASVIRAFDILKLFSGNRTELTATTVADELGFNGVTAHRFLKTLESVGALVSPARGVYRLGYLLVDLAGRVRQHQELADALQPILDRLTDTMQESTFAAVMEGNWIVCIARAVSRQTLSVDVRIGVQIETYSTAHGKVWLASLGQPELAAHLDAITLSRLTPETITDRAQLLGQLDRVRRLGFAVNDGEREAGIRAIAVPVTGRDGKMIASLSVFGPQTRMTEEVMNRSLTELRRAADRAREALYGQRADAPR